MFAPTTPPRARRRAMARMPPLVRVPESDHRHVMPAGIIGNGGSVRLHYAVPRFDPPRTLAGPFPSRNLWIVLVAILAFDTLFILLDPRLIVGGNLIVTVVATLVLGTGLMRLRRETMPWIGRVLHTLVVNLSFIVLGFFALRFLHYSLMSLALPMADDALARADDFLGLNWSWYANVVTAMPPLLVLLAACYKSLIALAPAAVVALVLLDRHDRVQEYLTLFFGCGLAVALIGSFLPADGTVVRYATEALRDALPPGSGVYHLAPLQALRDAPVFVFSEYQMPGLIEFPSFHTAAALLTVYAFRHYRLIFPLASLWAALLIAATPLLGGHYFVDIIAGALTALLAIGIHCHWSASIRAKLATAWSNSEACAVLQFRVETTQGQLLHHSLIASGGEAMPFRPRSGAGS